jgi:hypothetical protein
MRCLGGHICENLHENLYKITDFVAKKNFSACLRGWMDGWMDWEEVHSIKKGTVEVGHPVFFFGGKFLDPPPHG